ncbi:neuronal acetylcholine receptor subunit alpha-7 [Lingula anatina]|uniref:Neuronal acetylcholine receptor subunit alpha-7 n=1 Tax=Lingula anatina TaxID=7574 RepID=A0A1S3H6G0_LINAN|nr:neuronal acetylcholine receptor subunit alpha-7 [Lingula anatina]|eukprot:XP_013381705.1 neuronal acetylcholine receptor subunit alpha-7 [Lingula anatina]
MWWFDEQLQWDPTQYGNITTTRIPRNLLWSPDIILYNSVSGYNLTTLYNGLSWVTYTGEVFAPVPTITKSSCKMDLSYFPFDDQICHLKFGSWAQDMYLMDILNITTEVLLGSGYVENGEWDIVDTVARRNVIYYDCCPEPWPDVTFYLQLRRGSLYYGFHVVSPCLLLSFLSLVIFILPVQSGEKMTLGMSVLVAFAVFVLLIADHIPATSEFPPLISIYLTIIMVMCSFSIVMSAFVLKLHHDHADNGVPPAWIAKIFQRRSKRWCLGSGDKSPMKIAPLTQHGHELGESEQTKLPFRISDTEEIDLGQDVKTIQSKPKGRKIAFTDQGERSYNNAETKNTHENNPAVHWQDVASGLDRFFTLLMAIITIICAFGILVFLPLFKSTNLQDFLNGATTGT